jgi:hypothetical protein
MEIHMNKLASLNNPPRSLDEVAAMLDEQIAAAREKRRRAQDNLDSALEQLAELIERRLMVGEEISVRAVQALSYPPNP